MAKTIDRRGKFSLSIPWDIYFEDCKEKKYKNILGAWQQWSKKFEFFGGNF